MQCVVFHFQQAVGKANGKLQIVGREQDELVTVMRHPLQEPEGLDLGGEIQERRRLIKKNDRCLLGKCLGYHHFLPFAVRERLDHPVPQRFYPHGINGIADDPAVTGPQPAEETGIRRTPKTNHLFNCQILYIGLLRQDDAHLAC